MRLPELVPGAGAIAATCPSRAHPLAGFLVQGDPLRHPKSVAGAGTDAAPGPPYLHFSSLLLGALMRLPKLVPRAGAIAAACPLVHTPWKAYWCNGPYFAILSKLLELELMLQWPSYLRPSCLS